MAFPEIPAEELLDDKRDLSISAPAPKAAPSPVASTPSLFDTVTPSAPESSKNNLPEQTIVQSNLRRPRESSPKASQPVVAAPITTAHLAKKIERVLIFYTDGTFTESKPL
jgi:hypothetical protein